ncbi:MAG TPA: aldose epimerase family protein [Caulobacteraceae bacterium]|nr:aldose epimerase family protein [Caulobacteraceae bacterium]
MEIFGTLPDGRAVERHRLEGAGGVAVDILNFGGVIQRLFAPDRQGRLADVTLGFAGLDAYLANSSHLGALIGRCANRIGNGRIEIDGVTYLLSRNRGQDTLHGGDGGFHQALWTIEAAAPDQLHLSLESPDGDQGFPGAVRVDAVYRLSRESVLRLDFQATTTRPTVVNLTSHAYWNLAGEAAGDVLDHTLRIEADAFTPMNERFLPTGEIRAVEGSPFDFRKPARPLRERVMQTADPQIELAGGIDHNFVLRGGTDRQLAPAARLADPASGRMLEVATTEPGLQVYTGNGLQGGPAGKSGRPYPRWGGVALETQHFPDAPHHPAFPSILLRPGEVFTSSTEFRFGVLGS